jgi:DNA mismatch repair protein MutS2
MELKDVIFIDSFPKLDLHGFDRETAIVSTNDFINDNKKMKNEIFVIIHGIGSGIMRKTVHETLRKNKNVIDYKTFYNNNGSTIVKIKI